MPPLDVHRSLEGQPHAERVRFMVDFGRNAARTSTAGNEAAETLAALSRGDGYERRLALCAAWGSRDPAVAIAGLTDPSRLARGLANRLICYLGDDAQLLDAVTVASPAARRAMLARLRKLGRNDVVDAVLEGLEACRDPRFGTLLAYGSAAFVAKRLSAAAETIGGLDWPALARSHSQAVADWLIDVVTTTTELNRRLAAQATAALPVLSARLPDAAVLLAAALAKHVPVASLPLQTLVSHRPAAIADLYLPSGGFCPVSFVSVARRLDRKRVLALLARFGSLGDRAGAPARWLHRLPQDLRGEAYQLLNARWRDRDGAISHDILTLLPRPMREAEAHRHLALPTLASTPAKFLPYAGLLPWDEAHRHLLALMGDSDADLRAAALSALVGCVRFERGRAGKLLALVLARRFEQDPVRRAMLNGLADLPPSTWQARHLDDLGTTFRQALDAADLSSSTALAIERIIAGQLSRFTDWAIHWLVVVARERGNVILPGLAQNLRKDDLKRVLPALDSVLREWVLREHDGPVVAIAQSVLCSRSVLWDGLADALEAIARRGAAEYAGYALRLLAAKWRQRFETIVPLVLQQDPSWVTLPIVYDYLSRHRQDLLTPFLGREIYKGRFASGKVLLVLPFRSGFERWTPHQQRLFAMSLGAVIDDEKRDSPTLLQALLTLAALPDAGLETLERLSRLEGWRVAGREAALRGLGRRDSGDGVPILLAALDDGRARTAIYALRRALLEQPAGQALSILRGVSRQKVTVAKEVVRLVGELPGEDAYAWLLEMAAGDGETAGQHRDVFIAVLRALWSQLERDETWAILDRAATTADPAIATFLARVPADPLSSATSDRLVGLLAALLAHPDPRVRIAALYRCRSEPLDDRREMLLAPLRGALASPLPDECRAAAATLFATYFKRRAVLVGETAAALQSNPYALSVLVLYLQQFAADARERAAPSARAVLGALSGNPARAGMRAELAAGSLPASEVSEWFRLYIGSLHGGAMSRAIAALEAPQGLQPYELRSIEGELSAEQDERLRRLALAALRGQAYGARQGWNTDRLVRLETYKTDPSPLVAEVAQFTFPPGEPIVPLRRDGS